MKFNRQDAKNAKIEKEKQVFATRHEWFLIIVSIWGACTAIYGVIKLLLKLL